jgi:hypothetical protein
MSCGVSQGQKWLVKRLGKPCNRLRWFTNGDDFALTNGDYALTNGDFALTNGDYALTNDVC